jgi:hypothetical protein
VVLLHEKLREKGDEGDAGGQYQQRLGWWQPCCGTLQHAQHERGELRGDEREHERTEEAR